MARFVSLGVQPSEFRNLRPGEAKQLLERLEKRKRKEEDAEVDLRSKELEAQMSVLNNVVKSQANTNELLVKLIRKPTIG